MAARHPHPPLDPELDTVLKLVHEVLPATITPDDIAALRANPLFHVDDEILSRGGTVELHETTAPGLRGGPEVPLLVLRPVGLGQAAPIFFYLHGGGMIIGNNRTGVTGALDWAIDNGAVVVSVDYRLAPEHPDPARLLQAGVQCELHVWPGGFHGFDTMAPLAALSAEPASRSRPMPLGR
jgi:acetyl esterase/lipase